MAGTRSRPGSYNAPLRFQFPTPRSPCRSVRGGVALALSGMLGWPWRSPRRHGPNGRPAGTFRHLVPAGQSIVKEHARLIAERFLAMEARPIYFKRAVIVGEESL